MKKMLSVLLAVMLMMSLLAVPALAEDQVLTVVTWDATTTPYLIAQKEAFEDSHPGITIEYVDVASQDYAVKATTMLEGGDTSDVFMIKEIDNLINWQAQGFAAPLADYVAAGYLLDDVGEEAPADNGTREGRGCLEGGVLHVAGLVAEDGPQQLLFR